MLGAISGISEHAETDEQRSAHGRQAELVFAAGERDIPDPADLNNVERAYHDTVQAVGVARRNDVLLQRGLAPQEA